MTVNIKGYEVLIDEEDVELVNSFSWHARIDEERIYFHNTKHLFRMNGKNYSDSLHLHRLIMKCPDGLLVDHINGNQLDNRKSNLRICTNAENARNQKKRKDNTSGYKGVSWSKEMGQWKAQITKDGQHTTIGYFEDKDVAYRAYCHKAKELFGEFARLK